jgi:hypothetical protein
MDSIGIGLDAAWIDLTKGIKCSSLSRTKEAVEKVRREAILNGTLNSSMTVRKKTQCAIAEIDMVASEIIDSQRFLLQRLSSVEQLPTVQWLTEKSISILDSVIVELRPLADAEKMSKSAGLLSRSSDVFTSFDRRADQARSELATAAQNLVATAVADSERRRPPNKSEFWNRVEYLSKIAGAIAAIIGLIMLF